VAGEGRTRSTSAATGASAEARAARVSTVALMGDADATGRLLTTVQSGSQQLLRSCVKLAEALPVGGAAGAAEGAVLAGEWPRLLGLFKQVAAQMGDLGGRADLQQLEHVVAVPTNPAAQPDGRPSMAVPELLRTKRVPEQEREEDEIRKLAEPFLPAEEDAAEREQVAGERLGQMRHSIMLYNREIDSAVTAVLESEQRARLKRKAADTVTRFAAKRAEPKLAAEIDLLAWMHTGQQKPSLVELAQGP
jgi:hypothetical protein